MSNTKIKIDAQVRQILTDCFPDYRGRKVSIHAQSAPLNLASYWDGGSRDFFVLYSLTERCTLKVPPQSMFDRKVPGVERVTLPDGIVCVEHSIFCGKDIGITIHVNPANLAGLLPATTEASHA